MSQSPNQFKQSNQLGAIDLSMPGGQTISCQVGAAQSGNLVPGDPVKLVDTARGGRPRVVKAAADTDVIFGYVPYNQKEGETGYPASANVEILQQGAIVLRATAAFIRGIRVGIDLASTGGVKTAASNKSIIGWAYDKATADADLVRIQLDLPAFVVAP